MSLPFGADDPGFVSGWRGADRVTVHWCPVIKKEDWDSEPDALEDGVADSLGVSYPTTDAVQAACRQLGIQDGAFGLVESVMHGLVYDDDDAGQPSPYYVARASDQLAPGEAPGWAGWERQRLGAPAEDGFSFGLWVDKQRAGWDEDQLLEDVSWVPELNSYRRYATAGLDPAAFLGALRDFAEGMFQRSMFFTLDDRSGRRSAWVLGRDKTAPGGYGLAPLGPYLSWFLRTTDDTCAWSRQFQGVVGVLRAHREFADGARAVVRAAKAAAEFGLGATFSMCHREHTLVVDNAGGAAFLFAPLFWSAANDRNGAAAGGGLHQLFRAAAPGPAPPALPPGALVPRVRYLAVHDAHVRPGRDVLYEWSKSAAWADPRGECREGRPIQQDESHQPWPAGWEEWMPGFFHG